MPLHGGNSLRNFSLNVQSKLISKIAKKAAKGSLKRYDVLSSSALDNLNQMYDFIKAQDGEETAKTVVNNSVAVMCKVAVVMYNDLFTEREEDLLLEMMDAEKELIMSFLKEAEQRTGNYSDILRHVSAMEEKADSLIRVRFSEKTRNKAKEFFMYFSKGEVYQFLFTDSSAEQFLDKARAMFNENLSNLEHNKRFILDRREKHGRIKKLKKMIKEIQAEQFTKLGKEWDKTLDPSEDMIGERGLQALSMIQMFIELESKDERKAEELIGNVITVLAKLEAGFSAEIFDMEDQTRLFDFVGTIRNLIETFVSVRDPVNNSIYESAFADLMRLYDEAEEKLCELLRHQFGGNALSRVRSFFYYFKKTETNMFYFKEMQDDKIREQIDGVLRKALFDIPAHVLCEPSSNLY